MGLIKNVDQYFTVLNTGRLDSMMEGDQAELLLIRSENEKMMDAIPVSALALDNHALHIQEHKAILADPDLRNDPMLVQITLNHIQEHIDLLRNTDPGLLALTRQQPLPPLEQMMPQPPAPEQQVSGEEGAPIPEMMEGQTNFEAAQDQTLPELPSPPPPFENAPISPADTNLEG
jgi:hypothetical protein